MQMISEAIVAGSLEALLLAQKEAKETNDEAEKRRVELGIGNRAERRRVAALQRKKSKHGKETA